ncbi:hypothetical protein F5B17DRAFT_446082 [Nemania serpens]|nr:hypothetical protein F5B17DRAFT_446082 [Nemania serpens]
MRGRHLSSVLAVATDNIQYLKRLHDLFPSNSETISSGPSYENRSPSGMHLWGAGGPGKPAVSYHGTTTEYLTYKPITGYNTGDKDIGSVLDEWTETAQMVSDVIRDSSSDLTTFIFGPSGAALHPTTGAASDHIHSIGRANFSYTIELRDIGNCGFVLLHEPIRPAG